MDLDTSAGVGAPSGVGEDLKMVRPEAHRVVVLDGPQVLEAADGVQVEVRRDRTKRRRPVCGRACEALIVARDVGGEEGVRAREVSDAGQAQFTDQSILEGAAGPLDASLGLGRRGGDPLDAQFGEGAADLSGSGLTAQLLLKRERRALRPLEDAATGSPWVVARWRRRSR